MRLEHTLTLLSLGCRDPDDDLRLLRLCMSVGVIGVDVRLATRPAHVLHPPRRCAAQVLVVAGLDAPEHDVIGLIGALGAWRLGLIAIIERERQRDPVLAAGVDRALPVSIDREAFVAEVQSLLQAYAPTAQTLRHRDGRDAQGAGMGVGYPRWGGA